MLCDPDAVQFILAEAQTQQQLSDKWTTFSFRLHNKLAIGSGFTLSILILKANTHNQNSITICND